MTEPVMPCPDCDQLLPAWGLVRCPYCGTGLEIGPLRNSSGKPLPPRHEVRVNGKWIVACEWCGEPIPSGSQTCTRCGRGQAFVGRRKQPRTATPLEMVRPITYRRTSRTPAGCSATALLLALLVLLATACSKSSGPAVPTQPPGGALVAFGSHVVAVELAVTQAEWQKGLMNRKTLGANSGMLFLFPTPSGSPFYMKDTLIPLSVAFLQRRQGQTYKVIGIQDMTPCHADPCKLYYAPLSYDAALEVNEGWFARHGVDTGSTAQVGRAPAHS